MALVNREWDGVIDEVDLMLFASERLRSRAGSSLARQLLAISVSRAARWDFDTAASLLDEGERAILAPLETLRQIARRMWSAQVARMWSAQVAVLMPRIEELRHESVQHNLADIKYRMRRHGMDDGDPHHLELGELTKLFKNSGGHWRLRNSLFRLRDLRNRLAHLSPLPPDVALELLEADGQVQGSKYRIC